MKITVPRGAFWATLEGDIHELAAAQAFFGNWSRALDPKQHGQALCLVEPGRLRVPAGAVLALGPQAPILTEAQAAEVAKLAGRLVPDWLYDFQAEAVHEALAAPLGRAIVDAVMGAGKTRICAGLAAVAQAAGIDGEWLYLVQNTELAEQSAQSFAELLPEMAAALGATTARIRALNYGAIKRLVNRRFAGVLVDECHLLAAPTRCLAYATIKAEFHFGLSGTVLDRQDAGNALTIALLGLPVTHVQLPELEKRGLLSRGQVKLLRYDRTTGMLR